MIRCLIIVLFFSASLSSCSEYRISKKDFAHLIEMRGTHPEIPELDSIALRISRNPEVINEIYNDSSKVTEFFMKKFDKEENRIEVIEDFTDKAPQKIYYITSASILSDSYSPKLKSGYVCIISNRKTVYLVMFELRKNKWYLDNIRHPIEDPMPAIDLSK